MLTKPFPINLLNYPFGKMLIRAFERRDSYFDRHIKND